MKVTCEVLLEVDFILDERDEDMEDENITCHIENILTNSINNYFDFENTDVIRSKILSKKR